MTPGTTVGERLAESTMRSDPMRGSTGRRWVVVGLVLFVLALVFQGSRGLADPDEGFYSNVAMGMVTSGDWLLPRLNDDLFLDKPPLLYWSIAGGIALFGPNEWAARCVQGLWFAGTALLVGLIGRALWGRALGPPAALAYGTTLLPFLAGNILTTDTPLAFFTTLAVLCYWRFWTAESRSASWSWGLLWGLAAGLGILAKGPATALVLLPLGVHLLWTRGWRGLLRAEILLAAVIALAVGGSWYVTVGSLVDGAWSYWMDNQVSGRLWSHTYARNAQWWGGFEVYLPTLLVGGLPWTPMLLVRALRRSSGARGYERAKRDPRRLLLALWFTVPLVVLLLASSRLPLYCLPIFPPMVLAAVRSLAPAARSPFRSRTALALLVLWAVTLLGFKLGAAHLRIYQDTRRLARGLEAAGVPRDRLVVSVDAKTSALRFYGYENLANARLWNADYPFFVRWPTLETTLDRNRTIQRMALVCDHEQQGLVDQRLREAGFTCEVTRLKLKRSILDCERTPPQGEASPPPPRAAGPPLRPG